MRIPWEALTQVMNANSSDRSRIASAGGGGQSLDEVLDALAHRRRRVALSIVQENGDPVSLSSLAENVAIRETQRSLAEIPAEQIQAVSTSLHHVHLPKLVAVDAVRYDREHNVVVPADPDGVVERVLSVAGDGDGER